MKIKTLLTLIALLSLLCGVTQGSSLGTAFTYQGRLLSDTNAANGSYDLQFTVFQAATNGAPLRPTSLRTNIQVANGLFTVDLDFGGDVFFGELIWLEIGVRTNGAAGFTTLSPRQALTATPNALHAAQATAAGTLLSNAVIHTLTTFAPDSGPPFAVNNTNKVPNLNSDFLDGLEAANFWQLSGNASTTPGTHFLGTTDNAPLEFRVNGERALRLEPAGPSLHYVYATTCTPRM